MKVIDYTKVLKDNEVLQDMDKILRNENTNLKLEIERLNNIINITKNNIEITMQIIKEQPTDNDEWLLERLNGINNILKGSDKE